jgi:glycosyltransferase involved in cell wall biosynthesis
VRLVHLADYGGPYAGSFIPMIRTALRAGREAGFEVEALFSEVARGREWLADLDADGIAYRFAPARSSDAVAEMAAGAGPDSPCILHSHFSGFDLEAAALARGNPHVHAFWHVHSGLHRGAGAWLKNAVRFRLLSRGVTEILCVAPQIESDVLQRLAPAGRVAFFPNAIDTRRFAMASAEERRAARSGFGIPAGASLLLHFGRAWQLKGGDAYLGAVARLRESGRDVRALCVAGGEPALERARALGIEEALVLTEPTNAVERLYAAADLTILSGRAEGMPFTLVESLAAGTGAVATDAPGERYVGQNLAACRLVRPEPEPLASAAGALLDRAQDQVRRDADDAREWVVANMDLAGWADRLMERYRRALGG